MKKNSIIFGLSFLILLLPNITLYAKDQDTSQLESQSNLPQIKKAAEEGDPDAQYALGYMYYYGKGIQQDMILARQWIKKAADQGQQQAVQAEKILLGVAPSIQPKVNPVTQPNGESPDKAHAPVAPRDDMKKEPVPIVSQDQKQVSKTIDEEKPILIQKKALQEKDQIKNKLTTKPNQEEKLIDATPKIVEKKQTPSTKAKTNAIKEMPSSKNEEYFVIQLLSSSKKQDVVSFLAKSQLKEASYYETHRESQKWYVVVYGNYPTRKAANAAIQKLPEFVKKNNPWVKSSAMINKEKKKSSL